MGKNEINLADNLINIINTARENALKKVNEELINMYWQVGEYLHKESQKSMFGDSYIDSIAKEIQEEFPGIKGFNRRGLYRMKQFYNLFGEQKVSTMWTQLTWSHIRELLPLKDENAIGYYLNSAINLSLTQRELSEKIKSKEYERLGEETKNKLITNEELKLPDLVPNPILIKSEFNIEQLTEYVLKQAILNNLDNFLTQLGNGFSYIGNEYKLKIGNNYNYIDLLLYNVKFKCYVVVELKVTELKKEHIGQIQVYMNYIDKNVKDVSDDKTIGIIICAKNNQFIIEYCSDERIFAREFKITS